MKVTEVNGKIIIDFETKETDAGRIIEILKETEEAHRCAAEVERKEGWICTAAVDEIRADTVHRLLLRIDKLIKN